MDPAFIHRSRDVLARTARGQAATQLLTQSDNLEVSRHALPPSTPLKVFPPDRTDDSEIFYLLSGQLTYRDGDREIAIEPGDCIVTHEVDGSAYFEAATEVALLQISSLPAFATMEATNRRFYELAERVEADEHMEGHSKRLEHMASRLGHRMGLMAETMYHIRYAAYFHDIGKAKVPQHIIQKPGSLSDEEWATMKRHSEWGRELLEEQPGFEDVGRIVEQIHERIDGGGYPHGLTDDEIRLEAKIVAVVDAYDAMTTDRPYSQGMPHEDALAELEANAGAQFDPDVVDAFVAEFGGGSPGQDPLTAKHEFARWSQTESFLELGERILAGQDLPDILDDIVTAITEHTPFQRAALGLYDRPIAPESIEQVRIVRSAQAGLTPEEEAQLRANPLPPEERKRIFQEEFRLSRSYYIPIDRTPWGERSGFVTGHLERQTGNWHAKDMLFIPLWLPGHQVLGLISVDDPVDGQAPTARAIEPIELFANLAALAIEKTQNIHALQDHQRRLQSIYQLSESLGTVTSTDDIIRRALQILTQNFEHHYATFLMKEGEQLVSQDVATTLPTEELSSNHARERLSLHEGIVGWVARHGTPALVEDARRDERYLPIHPDLCSELAVPVIDEGHVIGVLNIESCDVQAFHQQDRDLLQALARQLAMAISNIRHRQTQAWTNRFLQRLNAAEDLDDLLRRVLEQAIAYLHPKADAGNVLFYEKASDRFEFRVVANRDQASELERLSYERDELLRVLHEAEPTILTSSDQYASPVLRRPAEESGISTPGSTLCIPIRDPEEDELMAFLNINRLEEEGVFTRADAASIEPLIPEITAALKRARDRERLQQQATRDPLTGSHNRHYFAEYVATERARAERLRYPISMLMIDFDHFHTINDRFGHLEGDRVLREAAQLFQTHAREADTIVRYGGDEFLILMPQIDRKDAERAATRIHHQLAQADLGLPEEVSVSVGVSTWSPDDGDSFEAVLEEADRWMYRRKRRKSQARN